jgi:hypothetical protein
VKRTVALAVLALAAACADQPREPEEAGYGPDASITASPRPAYASNLGAYLEQLRGMNEAKLAAEAARQRAVAARDASDLARVKAALALSLAPRGDEAEILALVEPVLARPAARGEVPAMASFLQAMATERRRLKESAAAAGTRATSERRAHESEKQRADALQARADELQQKLDALSSLEKSLSDRPSTPSR